MNIKQIHMYRYGMFSDRIFDLPSSGLQVVYGLNEAGKSTIMQLIRDVLFGFSPKSPGITQAGSDFGGSLKLEVPSRGLVTIERIGNKGKGSVNVFLSNGRTAGEDVLVELFPGLDATTFRSIFSFGLDGLQGLEHIDADELNDYLFHAGMTGDFSIRELEKKLAKKQGELFKPQGRKPKLNAQLAELERLGKDVTAWQNKNDDYRRLAEEAETIRSRIDEITHIRNKHKKEIRRLQKQKTLAPYIKEKREWQLRLEQLPIYEPFPEDGLTRFDHWQTQVVALEAECEELEARRQTVADELDNIEIHGEWLRLKDEVRREREEEHFIQSLQNEKAACIRTAEAEAEEITALMEKLGSSWTEERVAAADTGLAAKEALRELVRKRASFLERQHLLDSERIRVERVLETARAEEATISGKRLADEEHARLEETIRLHEQREKKKQEKEQLETRLTHTSTIVGSQRGMFYGGTAMGIALTLWMMINGRWWTGMATALLTAVFVFYVRRSVPSSEAKRLQQALATIDQELGHVPSISIEEVQRAKLILEEDERMQQSAAIIRDRLDQVEKTYADAIEQIEAASRELEKIDERISEWCRKHGFPDSNNHNELFETFERVEEVKTRMRRRNRAQEACQNIEMETKKRENKISRLCGMFGIGFETSTAALIRMDGQIQEEEQKQQEKRRLEANIYEYDEQIRLLKEKIRRYDEECKSLMRQAQTDNEETFRRKGRAWHQSREILENLTTVEAKIESMVPDASERQSLIPAILHDERDEESEIQRLESEIEQLEAEERKLYETLADLRHKQRQLEEGGTYAQLLHQFQQKKDVFQRDAKRWAVYRTAAHLLQKAKEQYRNKRLPKVVEDASHHFSRLTGGRYVAVYAPTDEGFVVERSDGVRFSPEQLSRGTAEQLYLALRFSLAKSFRSPSPYPLIMDDILVNFDAGRTEKAIEVIREMAEYHQVLFFTCHEHLLRYFRTEEIVSTDRHVLTTP